MTFLDFDFDSYEVVTREASNDDAWDRDDTFTTWTLKGANIENENEYFCY